MSSCKIIEGRLPQKKNEIAIEKYLINLFDNAKIGSSIEIKINNKVDKYVITGYVRNYSMTLNVNIDKPNEDCYPVIILGSENRTKQKYTSFLAGWRNESDIGYDEEKEIDKIRNELKMKILSRLPMTICLPKDLSTVEKYRQLLLVFL